GSKGNSVATPVPSLALVPGVLTGQPRSIARLISRAEAGDDECRPALAEIYRHTGRAHRVGVTGVPGSGKSTLVRALVLAARTTVLVSAPGLGDDIQAIKAGILEIADIHVVSKCDRADASRTIAELKQMLLLGLKGAEQPGWEVPVLATSAARGEGIDDLLA